MDLANQSDGKKTQNRRKIKTLRKNRVKESREQKSFLGSKKKSHEEMVSRRHKEDNKEQLDSEFLTELTMSQKLPLIRLIGNEIIADPQQKYAKLKDLLLLVADNNVDVVVCACRVITKVFKDIIPQYRIRIDYEEDEKGKKLSKDVLQLRDYEQALVGRYKEFLQVLETFSKSKLSRQIRRQVIERISDKDQAAAELKRLQDMYLKLQEVSSVSLCILLRHHPNFNFRVNILQSIAPKLSSFNGIVRKEVTLTFEQILKNEEKALVDFKLEVIKEMAKVIKQKAHSKLDPNLLDCLLLHTIVVNEDQVKVLSDTTSKNEELKQKLGKLRKKGHFKEYKEVKQELLKEIKEADAIGVDLGKASKVNSKIIQEILGIYFEVLKSKNDSPLLKSVFLGLPSFTQYINVEIVWDLIGVLREYLKLELSGSREHNLSNLTAGLLCSFQIIEVGVGQAFNVEEKDFMDCLYTCLFKFISPPAIYTQQDFLALLKCLHIAFVQKRQYSVDLITGFLKRLAITVLSLPYESEKVGMLLLLKQILVKYPQGQSMVELDPEMASGGLLSLYRADINDPQLANANQTNIVFEMVAILQGKEKQSQRLCKAILNNGDLPNEYLGKTPVDLCKELYLKDVLYACQFN